jgi:leucyl-tRNA synthetase
LIKGVTAVHPLTGESIPVFVADYVLAGYGTGAIMAVPGHDQRDREFAEKYNLPLVYVTQEGEFITYADIKANPTQFKLSYSQEFDGQDFVTGRAGILNKLSQLKKGHAQNEYKLRDWLISRQRYWGAPIPIVYDPQGNAHPVKEEHLPWLLPTDVDFKPTGESPLKSSQEFHERTERLYGKGWRPEYDTMDTFVDSSWYFLRYVDSRNSEQFARPEQIKHWLPIDLYMIGPEHIVLHLLYSRFFTKFLRDQGHLAFDEPFMKMRHQGMILGPDGKKMSKSKGNVINPDEVIEKFGADTLRVYEMFMGPLEADKPWNVTAVAGVYRFLQRVYGLVAQAQPIKEANLPEETAPYRATVVRKLHQTLRKVSEDIPKLKFNTAIAAMMEFTNTWEDALRSQPQKSLLTNKELLMVVKMLAPFAPFLAEELYQTMTVEVDTRNPKSRSIHVENWPAWNVELATESDVVIPVQVNGKVRAQVVIAASSIDDQAQLSQLALALPEVQKWLEGKTVRKEIYVPGKILNLVVG